MFTEIKPGVVYGKNLEKLYKIAKENNFAIPAINVVGSNSINAALEAAKEMELPIIIQFSSGSGKFIGGNGLDTLDAQVLGTVSGALHVHTLAEKMGVRVILHTDHANKKALAWIDGLLEENKKFYKKEGRPLFSSHMLDLSVEKLEENIEISKGYFKDFNDLEIGIEIEVGITGGEEEGADTTSDKSKMYTSPDELFFAYSELSKIGTNFTIAAMFGNVHGVYKPGNVELRPEILKNAQEYIKNNLNIKNNPINFVFHGGSGSEKYKIKEAINYGVVKMNIDTDMQWAFWEGIKNYIENNNDFMQSQIGNPNGDDLPNKSYYDPRKWLIEGQKSMKNRIIESYFDLNCKS